MLAERALSLVKEVHQVTDTLPVYNVSLSFTCIRLSCNKYFIIE